MTERYAYFALTNPAPGREADFNAWYDAYHLPEVVRYGAGMRGGRRFRLADTQRPGQTAPPWRYLAWYDLEHDDLAAFGQAPWRKDAPPLTPFTGLIADDFTGWTFTPIGDGAQGFASGCPRGDDFLFLALTNAGAGQEAGFNAWYDGFHLPEIVATLPGFVAGRRYQAAPEQWPHHVDPPWRYLATYTVQADNAAALHENAAGVKGLSGPPPGALDPNHVAWVFEPIGAYLEA